MSTNAFPTSISEPASVTKACAWICLPIFRFVSVAATLSIVAKGNCFLLNLVRCNSRKIFKDSVNRPAQTNPVMITLYDTQSSNNISSKSLFASSMESCFE
ncbi:hypothetical protein HanRHA438_Chr09g0399621 [Helianthus annuus]|nr:hypothetical protein HanRHA438_Chr09g0399621 [Helianthus annuus]